MKSLKQTNPRILIEPILHVVNDEVVKIKSDFYWGNNRQVRYDHDPNYPLKWIDFNPPTCPVVKQMFKAHRKGLRTFLAFEFKSDIFRLAWDLERYNRTKRVNFQANVLVSQDPISIRPSANFGMGWTRAPFRIATAARYQSGLYNVQLITMKG